MSGMGVRDSGGSSPVATSGVCGCSVATGRRPGMIVTRAPRREAPRGTDPRRDPVGGSSAVARGLVRLGCKLLGGVIFLLTAVAVVTLLQLGGPPACWRDRAAARRSRGLQDAGIDPAARMRSVFLAEFRRERLSSRCVKGLEFVLAPDTLPRSADYAPGSRRIRAQRFQRAFHQG